MEGSNFSAIAFLTDWIDWLALGIIPAGATFMIAYQAFKKSISTDDEEIAEASKRIRQTIKGAIVAVTIGSTIVAIRSFYGM